MEPDNNNHFDKYENLFEFKLEDAVLKSRKFLKRLIEVDESSFVSTSKSDDFENVYNSH